MRDAPPTERRQGQLARAACGLAVAAALLGAPAAAGAGDAPDAQALYAKGIERFEAGDYAAAADAFCAAHAAKPAFKLRYNIGQSEAAAARYGLALEAFEAYLVEGADDIAAERREEVLAEIQRLRVLVGVVEVEADAPVELLVDGVSRGVTPFEGPVRVAAGKHRVRLVRDGETVLDKTVAVAGGMTTALEVDGGAAPPPPTPEEPGAATTAPAPADEGVSGLFVGGVVAAALGAGGLGVGGYFTYEGLRDYDEYESVRAGGDRERYDELDREELPLDRAMLATGYAVGGALVATGVVLLVVDAKRGDEDAVAARPAPAVAARPAPGGLALTF